MRRRRKKLGLAFKDELLKVSSSSGHFKNKKKSIEWEDSFLPNFEPTVLSATVSSWRLVVMASVFLIIFFGLFLRLFHMQVVLGKENRERADSNRVKIKVIHAPRGVIYDRNEKVLAENNPGFRLGKEIISRDDALQLEAKNDPKFIDLEVDAIRFYPMGPLTAHVLGYVGQISEDELKEQKSEGLQVYKMGDRMGRAGIEQAYEHVLRGKDGAEIIEIDASGKTLRTLRKIDPVPGQNVYLSLDADLQKTAFKSLQNQITKEKSCCGAVVAEEPKTGEILALVSIPSFDSNAFTDPKRSDEVTDYFNDDNAPLLNRVIAGAYPPGSTFKIATALAGLSSGKINEKTLIEDTGVMSLGPYKFANWFFTQYGKTEGQVNLVKALQRSNDIYFYKVGDLIEEKILGDTAKKVGFGKKIGIDLPGEIDGLIPDKAWKEKNTGQVWYPGDNLHMAIGQGFLLVTPLQVAAQTAFVASDGNLVLSHLVTKVTRSDDSLVKEYNFEPIVKNIFKKEDLDLVKKGLSLVPKDGGTAWPLFSFTIPTAGKTGTAEFGDPDGKTHAWYTSYAPVDNPTITVTALVEAGGEGSSVAVPIVKDIYTWYFNPDKNNIQSLDTNFQASDSAKALGE